MYSPKISVVMPVYNASLYLEVAIKSILSQTFSDFEFIIVDDASTDNTWSIIQKYAENDKRIHAVQNSRNLKISKSLNKGINLARGKYIARMDADDWSYPYRLQEQYDFMESNPELVLSGGEMTVCDNKLTPKGTRKYPLKNTEIRKSIFKYSPFSHPTTIYKSDIAKKINGYHITYAEDIEFYLRIGKHGSFGNIPIPLIKYRTHKDSLISTFVIKTELATLYYRYVALSKFNYTPSISDYVFNFIELITIPIIPPLIKIRLFEYFRNKIYPK